MRPAHAFEVTHGAVFIPITGRKQQNHAPLPSLAAEKALLSNRLRKTLMRGE
jgi:hypothetical protein